MDFVPSSEHFCYVRCYFCNTVLAVGIPCKRLLDTVTVKCGHCSNLSFLSTNAPLQDQCLDHQMGFQVTVSKIFTINIKKKKKEENWFLIDDVPFMEKQGISNDRRKDQCSSSSSSTSSEQMSPKASFVVKPPEKKHRPPSVYNRFMKEEIQRIKLADPEIPHREAFSAAAKNWARIVPHSPTGSAPESNKNVQLKALKMPIEHLEITLEKKLGCPTSFFARIL
ncbi:hypothetical protein HHK36_015520 [Tetracentron sinense]|uniref:Crabs claw n=1 Tax=Tetracentron sinense TaxID=13715 RepID=A0A834Z374_TETSI|nr:hypothetical protein HHK36_015520 [Tetracentron sinense]